MLVVALQAADEVKDGAYVIHPCLPPVGTWALTKAEHSLTLTLRNSTTHSGDKSGSCSFQRDKQQNNGTSPSWLSPVVLPEEDVVLWMLCGELDVIKNPRMTPKRAGNKRESECLYQPLAVAVTNMHLYELITGSRTNN